MIVNCKYADLLIILIKIGTCLIAKYVIYLGLMRKLFLSFLEVVEVAVVAFGAVFLIRTFLVQPFLVSGASMSPNFSNGDYLLVDQLSYGFRSPARGEVIVFRFPKDESTYFIKRIIGLPGEKVVIRNSKAIVFNSENPDGIVLDEKYLPSNVLTTSRSQNPTEFNLGPEEYFVMGDNRSYSYDSRDWGVLKKNEIVGLARLRLWPPMGLTVFAAPQY